MLTVTNPKRQRILVYTRPADMRRGISGLSGIVRGELKADPTDGSLFLFLNRRRDRLKILHFAEGGWWLYSCVLEAETPETNAARP